MNIRIKESEFKLFLQNLQMLQAGSSICFQFSHFTEYTAIDWLSWKVNFYLLCLALTYLSTGSFFASDITEITNGDAESPLFFMRFLGTNRRSCSAGRTQTFNKNSFCTIVSVCKLEMKEGQYFNIFSEQIPSINLNCCSYLIQTLADFQQTRCPQ